MRYTWRLADDGAINAASVGRRPSRRRRAARVRSMVRSRRIGPGMACGEHLWSGVRAAGRAGAGHAGDPDRRRPSAGARHEAGRGADERSLRNNSGARLLVRSSPGSGLGVLTTGLLCGHW